MAQTSYFVRGPVLLGVMSKDLLSQELEQDVSYLTLGLA